MLVLLSLYHFTALPLCRFVALSDAKRYVEREHFLVPIHMWWDIKRERSLLRDHLFVDSLLGASYEAFAYFGAG